MQVDDPRIFVDSLVHADGRRFVFFVSQHPDPVTFTPVVPGTLVALDGSPSDASISLDPYGVAVRVLAFD